MNIRIFYTFLLFVCLAFSCNRNEIKIANKPILTTKDAQHVSYTLPEPDTKSDVSLEETLAKRRSRRHYQNRAVSATQLSQILWAAYGITQPRTDYDFMRGGLRTAPSSGAVYPLNIYAVIGNVKDIKPGVYKYIPRENKIVLTINKDIRENLSRAALNQKFIKDAPACIFYSATFSKTVQKYGKRGRERYVCMDLGHSAQNIYLQATALGLGTCAVGAFNDAEVKKTMQLPEEEEPLYIMPFGYYYDKKEL